MSSRSRTPGRTPGGALRFEDPEGLALELVVTDTSDRPLVARHPEIFTSRLDGLGDVPAVLVIGVEVERVERVRAVEGVACVMAIGPPILEHDDACQPAGAVR